MFIPIIPIVPNTTVVNKTIVYSDTVLSLKEEGKNLKITSLSDVDELSLEKCLKIIFESNPDTIFNTIQYSKKDKKVYFYTDKEISTKKYEERNFVSYKPVDSTTELLEAIKNVLVSEKNKDDNYISLFDVSTLITEKRSRYDMLKECNMNYYRDIIKAKFGSSHNFIIYDFDYDKNELRTSLSYYDSGYKKIIFSKKDGDLYIKRTENHHAKELLYAVGETLSKLYDEYLKLSDCVKEFSWEIRTCNFPFKVKINFYGVELIYNYQFSLKSYSYSKRYDLDCNSYSVISEIKGNEDELFKRVFVKISDCPKWSQPILSEIRKNQLAEENRIEEERKRLETKTNKKLELKRKLFPFFKKAGDK